MCSNTSTSPWHRHSAFSPGRLGTYRMFEWGNVTTRQWSSTSSTAMRAFATPKSICATPGAQTSSPVSVGTAPVRLAPASHVPRRRRVLAVVLGLRAEPVVHAFGGVALLAWRPAVGLEPSVDQRRVRVDLGALAPVHGRFRRHVVHIGVFRDSGAVHVRPPCDLRPGHSLTVQSPDILRFGIGIAIVLSFPSAAGCSRRICFWAASREYTGTAGWCLFSSGRSYGAVSAGNQQPMLRKNSAEIA